MKCKREEKKESKLKLQSAKLSSNMHLIEMSSKIDLKYRLETAAMKECASNLLKSLCALFRLPNT